MGANAIRMSHNPPAPELLELTDRMGFLVIDEVFDSWERKKTPLDFHLIFPDWHEQDLRSMLRRDRNHPSIMLWSVGNEVGEQYTGEDGAAHRSASGGNGPPGRFDPAVTSAMNYAKADMPLPATVDMLGLNYQGHGIRSASEPIPDRSANIFLTRRSCIRKRVRPQQPRRVSVPGAGVSQRAVRPGAGGDRRASRSAPTNCLRPTSALRRPVPSPPDDQNP
jgi:beta-galactosidase